MQADYFQGVCDFRLRLVQYLNLQSALWSDLLYVPRLQNKCLSCSFYSSDPRNGNIFSNDGRDRGGSVVTTKHVACGRPDI